MNMPQTPHLSQISKYSEIEKSFSPLDNLDLWRAKLKKSGALLIQAAILVKRVIFITPKIEFKTQIPLLMQELKEALVFGNLDDFGKYFLDGSYIRVRDEGDKVTLSIKIHVTDSEHVSAQKEVCLVVKDFESAFSLLAKYKLSERSYQENTRETWNLKNSEVCIDCWPGLEPYLEIESPTEAELEEIITMLNLQHLESTQQSVLYWYEKAGYDKEKINHGKLTFETDLKNRLIE